MAMIQKLGMCGLGGLMMLSVSSCNNLHKDADQSKQEALELINYKELKLKDYERLLEGEENATKEDMLIPTVNAHRMHYWDSIKTDALCKKAYLEGAQMVRDSIAKANAEKDK